MNAFRSSLFLFLLLATNAPAEQIFRDCADCPEMVAIPAGSLLMGNAAADRLPDPRTGEAATNDGPQRHVDIPAFAMGRYEVTVGEYAAFIAATGHRNTDPCMGFTDSDRFVPSRELDWDRSDAEQTNRHPAGCVSWFDAVAYTEWLSKRSGHYYRLPSEAEWEYAARAGSTTPYHWGRQADKACDYANVRSRGTRAISRDQAQLDIEAGFPCDDGAVTATPVGQFLPNDFGLHDMQGNAWEWVTDCNHKDYVGAPTDGSAWLDEGGCQFSIIRGGSFLNRVERSSTTVRVGRPRAGRGTNMGFRVVRGSQPSALMAAPVTQADESRLDDELPAGRLFNEHCQACHQERSDFSGLYGRDQAAVELTIRGGGNNIMSMPAFAGTLSAEEIRELAVYLRERNDWD